MYILSIIIPVYNSEKYLSKCIHSIIDGQNNNNNIEIILVDDGSTDQSSYLCDLFAKQYTNIHVFHQQNKGVAEARNRGIEAAHGEYIAWVDSDDYASPQWLSSIIKCLRLYKPDILIYDYFLDYNGSLIKKTQCFREGFVSLDSYIYELSSEKRLHSYLFIHIMKSNFYYKNCFNSKNRVMEDFDFLTSVATQFKKIYYLPRALYYYVQRNDSLNRDASYKRALLGIQVSYRRYKIFREKKFRVSKGAYWCTLFYAYNILIFHESQKNESNQILLKLRKDIMDIMLSHQVNNRMKIKILLSVLIPRKYYRKIYAKYKSQK